MPRAGSPNIPEKQVQLGRSTLAQRISSTGNKIEDLQATELFKMADKDNDGTLTADEFAKIQEAIKERIYAQLAREVELESSNQRMRRRIIMLLGMGAMMLVMLGLSVTATAILTRQVINQAVPVETSEYNARSPISTASLVTKDLPGEIAGTVGAETAYPLLIAPYLPIAVLENVGRITVSRNTIALDPVTGLEIDATEEDENTIVKSTYAVTGIDKVIENANNSTDDAQSVVIFYTARGDRLYVYVDSATIYVEGMNETYAVCLSDVTCSSITVEDASDVADLLENVMPADAYESMLLYVEEQEAASDELALVELVANTSSSSRRQLFGSSSTRSGTRRSSSRQSSYSSRYGGRRSSDARNCRSPSRLQSYSRQTDARRLSSAASRYQSTSYRSSYGSSSSSSRNRFYGRSSRSGAPPSAPNRPPPPPPPPPRPSVSDRSYARYSVRTSPTRSSYSSSSYRGNSYTRRGSTSSFGRYTRSRYRRG